MRERGLKCSPTLEKLWPYGVAPVRERGLKLLLRKVIWLHMGRSREGAWIEIYNRDGSASLKAVAPVRERGLK